MTMRASGDRSCPARSMANQRLLEVLAVRHAGERVGQRFDADCLERLAQRLDLAPGLLQPRVEGLVRRGDVLRRIDDRGDHVADLGAVDRPGEIVRQGGERLAVFRRRAEGEADHIHDLVDLGDYRGARLLGLDDVAVGREMRVVDRRDVLVRDVAALDREALDGIVHQRLLAADIGVPDLIAARPRRRAVGLHELHRPLGDEEAPLDVVRCGFHVPQGPRTRFCASRARW
jgi:hypothetical protein